MKTIEKYFQKKILNKTYKLHTMFLGLWIWVLANNGINI